MASTLKAQALTDSNVGNVEIKSLISNAPLAYVVMDTMSAQIQIKSQFNISSVTDNGVGDYTLNFVSSLPSEDYYMMSGSLSDGNNGSGTIVLAVSGAYNSGPVNKTKKSLTVRQWTKNSLVDCVDTYILIGGGA